MPSLLAAYAAHGIRSEGLPARVLSRIHSVRLAESIPAVIETSQQPKDESDIESLDDNPQEVEPALETALRKVLKQNTPQEALRVLHDIGRDESLPPAAKSSLILEFAADLLSRSGRTKPMQMGTLRAWVPKLVEHIGVSLQDSEYDILPRSRLSSDDLEGIYRAALDEIDPEDDTPSVRRCLVESLRAFHEFLVRKHRVKPLLDTSMFLLHRFGSTVDANLITFEEYHEVLAWLDRNWPSNLDPALQPMARIMVILGFRCGLRRNEALAINWFAVCSGGPKPELLIQPYSGHRLKSSSAKRRLPLSLLMDGEELKEILALALKRESASSGSITEDQMFAGVTARRLLPVIHKAMRAVTKDPSIKYHHLRHSFATWTFMRFMIGESGSIPEQLQHLPKTRAWLAGSADFCRRTHDVVCKVVTVDGQPAVKPLPSTTRLNAYLLAQMMGHSSPS
ncbi:MAG: hypothetical protein P4L40_12745, partial [Terracidiphilus sp.]|nr:hypothetical protein [Terracidiphilus sp.]